MRKITKQAVNAFLNEVTYNASNTRVITEGNTTKLYLFGHLIAEKTGESIKISNAGYFTNTTKERLNGLPNVSISARKGVWYLNGQEWNGEWININY